MTQPAAETDRGPILVTGAIRSGTTWVGRMIAASPAVGYIHEPFNAWIDKHAGICGAHFGHWFPYVAVENETAYRKPLKEMLEFRYHMPGAARQIRSWSDAKSMYKELAAFRGYRSRGSRPLVKDPLALFSAEWLAGTFGMSVIVLIRHPAAFVSSMKRLDWDTPFEDLLAQPLLMRDYLQPFHNQIREYARVSHRTVDRAILLWRLIYHVVARYRQEHPDWRFVRHEDLSRDPLAGFRDLYAYLDLAYSSQVQAVIREHSNTANPGEVPATWAHALKRDSLSGIWNWKQRLSQAEIDHVREQTADVASQFYSEDDW